MGLELVGISEKILVRGFFGDLLLKLSSESLISEWHEYSESSEL